MRTTSFSSRRGFTLVEMLVVITIIGILIALLIPTIAGVMRRTRNAAIAVELEDLAKAMEAYKSFANDYPPDFTHFGALQAHMTRAFPKNQRTNLVAWLNSQDTSSPPRRYNNLDPAEAIVFWLSLLSTNPRDPLSGADGQFRGERKVLFTFDDTRLVDVDGDGWKEYLPRYMKDAPYVYFDGRVVAAEYAYRTAVYPKPSTPAPPVSIGFVRPYRTNTDVDVNRDNGRTRPYNLPLNTNMTQWLKPGAFQIICAGQDNSFGVDFVFSNSIIFKTYPEPNYPAGSADEDNLANFSELSTFEERKP